MPCSQLAMEPILREMQLDVGAHLLLWRSSPLSVPLPSRRPPPPPAPPPALGEREKEKSKERGAEPGPPAPRRRAQYGGAGGGGARLQRGLLQGICKGCT